MAEHSLRISALGRNVRVGDFYNYFTDDILSSEEEVPDQGKEIYHTKRTTFSFFYPQSFKSKSQILGVNSHGQRYIDKKLSNSPDSPQPWFVHYLSTNPKDGDDEEAQVTAIFRVERRTETIKLNFMESRIDENMLKSGGLATHLVGDVVYGAEMICSFHRPIDLQAEETKDSVQRNIYLSAKNYFDQIIGVQSASVNIPLKLENVSCTIFSSLNVGEPIEKSFQEFNQYLQKICDSVEDDHPSEWKPIHLLLLYIPEQVKARIELDRKTDFKSEMEQHESTWTCIEEESRSISDHSSMHRFPLLKKVMSNFQDVLPEFRKKIDQEIQDGEYEKCLTEDALKKMRYISNFLNDVIDWLACRRHEIEEFSRLTSGTELVAMDLEEIKNQMAKKDKKFFKVFVVKVECKEDPIINYMQKEIGDHDSAAELPFVPIFSYEKESKSTTSKFAEFIKEAQLNDEHVDTSYYIELSQVSPTTDNGTIRIYNNLKQSSNIINDSSSSPFCIITIESNQNRQDHVENAEIYSSKSLEQLQSSQDKDLTTSSVPSADIEDESLDVTQLPPNTETKSPLQQMPTSTIENEAIDPIATSSELKGVNILVEKFEQFSINDKKSVGRPLVAENLAKNANNSSTRLDRKSTSGKSQDDDEHVVAEFSTKPYPKQMSSQHDDKNGDNKDDDVDDETEQSESGGRDLPAHEMPVLGDDRRIAEIFVDEKTLRSQLIRRGPPDIYLLNATEKSNGHDFKWFNICQPDEALQSTDAKEHKVIILMGATGSGKSTLINGMINYILGVQWKDPFRFKCIRGEENARSQAHSQTSSVTAYTLRYQKGMTIPYSITIIDTPGYGDTRGIKQDKEITAAIHSFLTQQEIPVDEIHAACFVAASGDSRLTPTQRYIIESVLSIFGKDMKENLRLLATFADNDDPPVVEACKLANFPATSTSDGITYSKFNSAILYCSNVIHENELSFDELFWDMGQENFDKFFTMLAEMDGRSLASTREVIQRRQQLIQSLEDIGSELETFLVKIEEIEKYRQELKKYDDNKETNKRFAVESVEMYPVKVDCDSGFMAYNCISCKKTCDILPSRPTNFKKRLCKDDSCRCALSNHEFQPFTWRLVPAKVKRIRNEMETQLESNANGKLATEELMENCLDELNIAKATVLSLLEQIGVNASSLDAMALRSHALNPAECLSLMRSRILEEQVPGYEIRLQILTDLQQSLNASAKASTEKGLPRDSNVTTQPVKSDNASRSRAEPISATGIAGESKSKSRYPGKNGRDGTPPRSSRTSLTSGGQVTALTDTKCEISSQTQRYMNKTNHSGFASTTTCNTQTYGRSRGRGRGYPANQTETAASIIHGTDYQWNPPPGSPKEYYEISVKTSNKPTSTKDFYFQYPDTPSDSVTGPSSSEQEKRNKSNETEVNSSSIHLGDDRSTFSSDDENKKTERKSTWGFASVLISAWNSLWSPRKPRN